MTGSRGNQRGKAGVVFIIVLLALVVAGIVFGRPLRRLARESFMQEATSTHYKILCLPRALSADDMRQFAAQREPLFAALDGKLGDAGSNAEIRIIFDSVPPDSAASTGTPEPYVVTGTTIRTQLFDRNPQLDSAADAEALLHVAWGKPGNAHIARWASIWLVSEVKGQDLGMAAADVEQRYGHQKVASVLGQPPAEIASTKDRDALGAAWISQIAEFGGSSAVRKLYSAKLSTMDPIAIAQALGTTPNELERKWQLWMYAYLAGMPAPTHSMPMNMEMK
jgi:hypothetical protein